MLVATPSTSAPGTVDLGWFGVPGSATNFGNYALFVCSVTSNCNLGTWTTNPADLGPWTKTNLVGQGTTTTHACGTSTACTYRIGYVDGSGNIGGVSNAVTAAGVTAPTLTAVPGLQPGSIDLSWTPPGQSGTITSYQIYRDTGSGFSSLNIIDGSLLAYTDPTCGPGNTCTYKVRALYTVGTSADSAPQTATAPLNTPLTIDAPVPGAVTGDTTPTLSGSANSAAGDGTTVTVEIFAGPDTTGALTQTLSATRSGALWTIDAAALANGTFTTRAKQTNAASAVITSVPVTFRRRHRRADGHAHHRQRHCRERSRSRPTRP